MKKINVLIAGLAILPVVLAASHDRSWRESQIDVLDAYAVLLYGPPDMEPDSWTVVARVGPPRSGVFPVHWVVNRDAEENRAAVEAVVKDLNFYLNDVRQPDPWAEVLHHCNTTSNWYAHVHWLCVSRANPPSHP